MPNELTEEEMRRALFGVEPGSLRASVSRDQDDAPVVVPPTVHAAKRSKSRRLTPKLRVTLRVGNEFEGKTELFIHEADTLSSLQAELDATKAARKKFRYIELASVKPVA